MTTVGFSYHFIFTIIVIKAITRLMFRAQCMIRIPVIQLVVIRTIICSIFVSQIQSSNRHSIFTQDFNSMADVCHFCFIQLITIRYTGSSFGYYICNRYGDTTWCIRSVGCSLIVINVTNRVHTTSTFH